MAAGEIHLGDIGTEFRVTIKDQNGDAKNIATASTKTFKFKKPDDTVVTKTATFYTDGSDGILTWSTTAVGDLDQLGIWNLQAYIVQGGSTNHSDITDFTVWPNIS